MEGTEAPKDEIFSFQFHSQGNICRLDVPLKLPYQGDAREHATRLVRGHKIPFHLENDLYQALDAFTKDSTMKMLDQEVEESLYGGSVFEKVGIMGKGFLYKEGRLSGLWLVNQQELYQGSAPPSC